MNLRNSFPLQVNKFMENFEMQAIKLPMQKVRINEKTIYSVKLHNFIIIMTVVLEYYLVYYIILS